MIQHTMKTYVSVERRTSQPREVRVEAATPGFEGFQMHFLRSRGNVSECFSFLFMCTFKVFHVPGIYLRPNFVSKRELGRDYL